MHPASDDAVRDAFQIRILAVALALATLAIAVLGFLNQRQESRFEVPTDGVWWLESSQGLRAERVPEDSPAFRAGVRAAGRDQGHEHGGADAEPAAEISGSRELTWRA